MNLIERIYADFGKNTDQNLLNDLDSIYGFLDAPMQEYIDKILMTMSQTDLLHRELMKEIRYVFAWC
jgi:hypothetical protein